MNNDAGWCGSGGPWITPELSMQKLVWSETRVAGPRRFEAMLPRPPAVEDFYRDITVLAFPTPAGEEAEAGRRRAEVTGSGGQAGDAEKPFDGNPADIRDAAAARARSAAYVQFELSAALHGPHADADDAHGRSGFAVHGTLQVSDDGSHFKSVRPTSAGSR